MNKRLRLNCNGKPNPLFKTLVLILNARLGQYLLKSVIYDKFVMKTSVLLNGGLQCNNKKEITKLMIISSCNQTANDNLANLVNP